MKLFLLLWLLEKVFMQPLPDFDPKLSCLEYCSRITGLSHYSGQVKYTGLDPPIYVDGAGLEYAECWQRCRLLAVEPELRRWQESNPGEDYFAMRESDQRKQVEGRVPEES